MKIKTEKHEIKKTLWSSNTNSGITFNSKITFAHTVRAYNKKSNVRFSTQRVLYEVSSDCRLSSSHQPLVFIYTNCMRAKCSLPQNETKQKITHRKTIRLKSTVKGNLQVYSQRQHRNEDYNGNNEHSVRTTSQRHHHQQQQKPQQQK